MKTEYFERMDSLDNDYDKSSEHYRTTSRSGIANEELKISYLNNNHGCFLAMSFNRLHGCQYHNDKYWLKILKRLRDGLYIIFGMENRVKKHHEFVFKNPNHARELGTLLSSLAEKVDNTLKIKKVEQQKEQEVKKAGNIAFTEKQFSRIADIIVGLKDVPEYREHISELRMIFHILGKDTRRFINEADRRKLDEKDKQKGLIDH